MQALESESISSIIVSTAHTAREQQAQLVAVRVVLWDLQCPAGWRDGQW